MSQDHNPGTVAYVRADILETTTFEAIANPVNCAGAMGAGLARQFARRYPEILGPYRRACRTGTLRPGQVLLQRLAHDRNPRFVIQFPTKDHWNGPSRLKWIEDGLRHMYPALEQAGVTTVALPALGAGLGGLSWKAVKEAIETLAAVYPQVQTHVCLMP